MNDLLELKKNIIEKHNKDQAQLQFIFSNYDKIIVEAPAGSGKTKTLISKIFYLIVKMRIVYLAIVVILMKYYIPLMIS